MSENLGVHLATLVETETVKSILDDAATLPIGLGIDQWPSSFDPSDVRANISAGGVYLFSQFGTAVGTVDYRTEDKEIWEVDNTDAAYLHRLAVRRTEQGKGLGETIIGWCVQKAHSENKAAVRLDCVTENDKLNKYYRELGFRFVTNVTWSGGQTSLYQFDL